jgi:hypothetical protein
LAYLQAVTNLLKTILLDDGLKFIQKDVIDASLPKYNDTDREIVTVPNDREINKQFDMNIEGQVVKVKADFEEIP